MLSIACPEKSLTIQRPLKGLPFALKLALPLWTSGLSLHKKVTPEGHLKFGADSWGCAGSTVKSTLIAFTSGPESSSLERKEQSKSACSY